ncbi:GNAT family N-acetyltransferase [Halalkalibacter urbisdiaboli]|uniref:GNAT family N-acetyltransferase n=1 Tax=Halalkalibacter urbisdiaboli TaxID=1960589 RepID=UPI000B42F617|nr:hypothetical protein [Halalkalibacter urbisdiaboli]
MSIVVRKANTKDLLPIQRLLAKAGLTEDGLDQHVAQFLVVENEQEEIIGTVGMEQYDSYGLLRSLVLNSPIWTGQLSLEFLQVTLSYAEEQGIQTVYLCAKGTNPLFQQLGFKEVQAPSLPTEIQGSKHYQQNKGPDTRIWACELDNQHVNNS